MNPIASQPSLIDWDKIIEYPRGEDLGGKIIKDLLKNSIIKECPYNKVFLKFSRNTTSDPTFRDDGVYADWRNAEGYPSDQILLIFLPEGSERSRKINAYPSSVADYARSSESSLESLQQCVRNIHVKILSNDDWENNSWWPWASTHRLSAKALECFSTTKHNIPVKE